MTEVSRVTRMIKKRLEVLREKKQAIENDIARYESLLKTRDDDFNA